MKNAKDSLKFKTELMVLHLLTQKDYCSYQIVKLIEKISEGYLCINFPVLYVVLDRLKNNGFISSYRTQNKRGVECVYYHIEEAGHIYLEEITQDFFEMHIAIQKILAYKE